VTTIRALLFQDRELGLTTRDFRVEVGDHDVGGRRGCART
jgi:hypothetical protein